MCRAGGYEYCDQSHCQDAPPGVGQEPSRCEAPENDGHDPAGQAGEHRKPMVRSGRHDHGSNKQPVQRRPNLSLLQVIKELRQIALAQRQAHVQTVLIMAVAVMIQDDPVPTWVRPAEAEQVGGERHAHGQHYRQCQHITTAGRGRSRWGCQKVRSDFHVKADPGDGGSFHGLPYRVNADNDHRRRDGSVSIPQ